MIIVPGIPLMHQPVGSFCKELPGLLQEPLHLFGLDGFI
jgi:hypothetical protein